jgi:Holliday junction DNA helicase RuvA
MIAFLKGVLAEKTPSSVILDVGGVGYEVFISLGTYDRLPAQGSPCELLTHHLIREDAQQLFGFATPEEKSMFERLIGVSGIGPKTALSALSGMTVAELSAAIANRDTKRISTLRGIGKKTAERIVVELHDKVNALEALAASSAPGDKGQEACIRDTMLALTSLGFQPDAARKMIQATIDAHPDIHDAETLLRHALHN